MNKLLSIIIVTKDRVDTFANLLRSIPVSWMDFCKFVIVDNSIFSISLEKFELVRTLLKDNFIFRRSDSFIKARNESIELVDTPLFYIMDDDDYFIDVPAFGEIVESMLRFKLDLVSFSWIKPGEAIPNTLKCIDVVDEEAKYELLNDYDNYAYDKLHKFYLCNGCKIYNTEKFKLIFKYKYLGYDDILPITDYYLSYSNFRHYYYPIIACQTSSTVYSNKSQDKIIEYSRNSALAYFDLMTKHHDKVSLKIIKKSTTNTYKQILQFDNYESPELKQLIDYIDDIIHNK